MKRGSISRRLAVLLAAGALVTGLALAWSASRRIPRPVALSSTSEADAQHTPLPAPFGFGPVKSHPHRSADSAPSLPSSDEDRAVFRRGTAAFEAGRTADAIKDFRQIVNRNPHLPLARAYLGLALLREKRYSEALKQFEEEGRLQPNPAYSLAHIADVHFAQGKLPAAISALEKAARLKPDLAQVHFNLGMLYPQALELGKGLAALDRYLELEPQNHYAQYLRGNLLYKLARLDDAESALGEAIRLSPRTGLYHYGLGQVHLRRKVTPETTERALSEFQLALDLDAPEPAAVHYHLGLCYQRKEDWESARRELEISTEMAPEAWGAFYALAEVLQELGRVEGARRARTRFASLREKEDVRMQRSFHEQEVQRNPQSPEARYQLAVFLADQGDRQKALQAASQALALAKSRKTEPSLRERIAALSEELGSARERQ